MEEPRARLKNFLDIVLLTTRSHCGFSTRDCLNQSDVWKDELGGRVQGWVPECVVWKQGEQLRNSCILLGRIQYKYYLL